MQNMMCFRLRAYLGGAALALTPVVGPAWASEIGEGIQSFVDTEASSKLARRSGVRHSYPCEATRAMH